MDTTWSNPIPWKLVVPSIIALESNAGYREENQKKKHKPVIKASVQKTFFLSLTENLLGIPFIMKEGILV